MLRDLYLGVVHAHGVQHVPGYQHILTRTGKAQAHKVNLKLVNKLLQSLHASSGVKQTTAGPPEACAALVDTRTRQQIHCEEIYTARCA